MMIMMIMIIHDDVALPAIAALEVGRVSTM
jgi:hypothetical protein